MRLPGPPWLLEAGAAGVLVPLGVIEVITSTERSGPLAVHVAVVVALGLALPASHLRPLGAALLGAVAAGAQCLVGWVSSAVELALFLLLVVATGSIPHGRARVVGLTALGAAFVGVLLRDPSVVTLAVALPSLVFFGAAAAAGVALARRTSAAAAQVEAAQRARREQEAEAERQLAAERTRLARELHDVVTHSLSVVVVQCGAMRLEAHVEQAERLAVLEDTARNALGEMRRLLGLLRGEPGSSLGPQPGIAQIPDLLDRMRAAGLEAFLEVTGEARAVGPGLDLTAYRIVQEATTNVLTHAAAHRVVVGLAWRADRLVVRVTDDGRPLTTEGGGGRGLLGLRERTELYAGVLRHGPVPGGGYQLCAELPLAQSLDPASA
jgi:signal transduction histidine kinase